MDSGAKQVFKGLALSGLSIAQASRPIGDTLDQLVPTFSQKNENQLAGSLRAYGSREWKIESCASLRLERVDIRKLRVDTGGPDARRFLCDCGVLSGAGVRYWSVGGAFSRKGAESRWMPKSGIEKLDSKGRKGNATCESRPANSRKGGIRVFFKIHGFPCVPFSLGVLYATVANWTNR